MEEIDIEKFISTLFVIGFEEINVVFYTYLLGKITSNADFYKQFKFINREPGQEFIRFIEFDGIRYKLREGYTMETNISPVKGQYWPISDELTKKASQKLIMYLNDIDMGEIVEKIVNRLGIDRIKENNSLLSNKEWELLPEALRKEIISEKKHGL